MDEDPLITEIADITATGDREAVTRQLRLHHGKLRALKLTEPNVGLEQAGKDFQRERVLLNNVPFVPSRTHLYKNHAFVQTVTKLVAKFIALKPEACKHDMACEQILRRACRTGAGADSLFMVQRLLCVEGTFAKHCSSSADPPIRVDLFLDEASGALCCRSVVCNTFAIHDLDNLEQLSGLEIHDPPPWMQVETTVVDCSNFMTGMHRRTLQLQILIPYGKEFKLLC